MIDIYLQYSYGGFKTFFIEGKENESVNKEVTNNENYGFPNDAHCYFQYGGAKIIYRYLNDGRLDLVVREIPSIHKDGDGRHIPCAVQFIADQVDRPILDHMATSIANDINTFQDLFSTLFRVKEGLRIDGHILRNWINEHNVSFICDSSVSQIKNIPNVKSGVILFVPLSKKFGIDDVVTQNVSSELKLPLTQMKNDNCIISNSSLLAVQGKSLITQGIKIKIDPTIPSIGDKPHQGKTVEQLYEILAEKEDKIQKGNKETIELNQQIDSIFNRLQVKTKEFDSLKQDYDTLSKKLTTNKTYLYIACGIAAFLAVCSIYLLIAD